MCQTFYAITDNEMFEDFPEENQFSQIKIKVYHLFSRLPRMGNRIPESWVQYEKVLQNWISRGIKFASVDEMFESYKGDMSSFKSLLSLYEDLGMIFFVEKVESNGLVVFDTKSFANLIAQLNSPFHFAQLVRIFLYIKMLFS